MATDYRRTVFLSLALLAVMAVAAVGQPVPAKLIMYPELIVHNGKILTTDDKFSVAEAVAIRNGEILSVGTSQAVLALKGPNTQLIDLKGKTAVPGFIEAHGHGHWFASGGGGTGGTWEAADNLKCPTLEACIEEIRVGVAKAAKPNTWVHFNGRIRTDTLVNQITRWDIDKASGDHPVTILMSTAMSIANSKAMDTIYKRGTQGIQGLIRDKNGEPNGHIRGQAVGPLDYDLEDWPKDWYTRLADEQRQRFRAMNSEGITTNIGRISGLGISVVNELWKADKLTMRSRFCSEVAMYNRDNELYLKRFGNLTGVGNDWIRFIGATVGPPDGNSSSGGHLTRLIPQHKVDIPGGGGWDQMNTDRYSAGENKWGFSREDKVWNGAGTEFEAILFAARYGWSVECIHAQGDIGAKMILDAFEQADKERPIKGRHFGFDHGQIRTAEDLQRAAKLGVAMSFDSSYVFDNPRQLVWMYGENVHQFTPVKSAITAGLKPAIELSDVRKEGEQSRALAHIQQFVTRMDRQGRMWGGREALSRQDALRMATLWSAAYSGQDNRLGSIEEGKMGDIVVLGQDYMMVPQDQIGKIPIDLTIVGGKIVYDRSKDGLIPYPEFPGFNPDE